MAQFNGTVEQLEQSVNTTESMADYVVESGELAVADTDVYFGSTWYWQIYKSGFKRCQIRFKSVKNLTLNDAWAGGYRLSNSMTFPALPINFENDPLINVNLTLADQGAAYNVISFVPPTSVSGTRTIQLFGPNVTIGHPVFQIVAEGY